jgi:hypothetical protein
VVQLELLWCREGGTLPWVVQAEGNERLQVGILQELLKCETIMYGFGIECLCVYGFWGQRAYVYVFWAGVPV